MRTKFKNLRRPDRADKAGIVIPPPAPKKVKVCDDVSEQSHSSTAEYERHIQYIQHSYSSKKWSFASMVTLMEQTADRRREWITTEGPSVKEVLEKFPCLADPRIVRIIICMYACVQ